MALSEALKLLVTADASGAVRELNGVGRAADRELGRTQDRMASMGSGFTRAGATMLAAGGVVAMGLWKAGEAASDLGESLNKAKVIFGSSSDAIEEFADGAASGLGMSKRAALDAAAGFGMLLDNLGLNDAATRDWSMGLTTLAADMGSFNNASIEETTLAIGSALRGESEPIRRFGVMLDDASVKAKAAEMGLASATGEVNNNAKAQARLALIMEQTSKQQGDFTDTSDSLANQQKILAANFENVKASIGEAAMPAMQAATGAVIGMADGFMRLDPAMRSTIGQTAVLGTGLLIVGGIGSTVVGQVMQMSAQTSKFSLAIKEAGGVMPAGVKGLRDLKSGFSGAALAAGAGLMAFSLWQNMMSEATASGEGFAAGVERDAFTSGLSFDQLTAKIQATRDGAVSLRESQSGGPIGSMIDADMNRELQAAASGLDDLAVKYEAQSQLAIDLGAAQGISRDSALQWLDVQRGLGIEFDNTGDAVSAFRESIAQNDEAINTEIASFDDLFKATSAYFGLLGSIVDKRQAVQASWNEFNELLKENKHRALDSTSAGLALQDSIQRIMSATVEQNMALVENGRITVEQAVPAIEAQRAKLLEAATAAGISTEAASRYIDELIGTPTAVATQFNLLGTAQAQADLHDIETRLVRIGAYDKGMGSLSAPASAQGGSIGTKSSRSAGTSNRSASIGTDSEGSGGGMGGGASVQINYNGVALSRDMLVGMEAEVVAAIERYTRSNGAVFVKAT